MDFTELIDLASEKLGGAVLYANDDFSDYLARMR